MTLNTQTTDRKAMAQALAQELGVEARYLRTPTYAYRVGDYTVNRDGSISGDDLEAIRPFLIAGGYIETEPAPEEQPVVPADEPAENDAEEQAEEPADEPADADSRAEPDTAPQQDADEDIDYISLSLPAPDMTPAQLRNLLFTVYSKQYLLNRMMNATLITIPERMVKHLQEHLPETPEDFSDLLLDSRAIFDMKGFDYSRGIVTLAVPFSEEESVRWQAFAGLLGRMIEAARKATRVFPELQIPESEKYAARNWLMRMGYGGADLKAERRELLKNLTGASAFPNAAKAQAHKDKYTELRRQEREMRNSQPIEPEVQEPDPEVVE